MNAPPRKESSFELVESRGDGVCAVLPVHPRDYLSKYRHNVI